MSFNQTRDLLDVARQFHLNLAGLYEKMMDRAANEEARALIGTLIEHEKMLEKQLEEYEEEGSANIMDTFFKYVVNDHQKAFQEYVLPDSISAMDVIEVTRHFDQHLADFYKEMARKSLSEQVRDVLLNLTQMELREQMNLSRRTLELVASY